MIALHYCPSCIAAFMLVDGYFISVVFMWHLHHFDTKTHPHHPFIGNVIQLSVQVMKDYSIKYSFMCSRDVISFYLITGLLLDFHSLSHLSHPNHHNLIKTHLSEIKKSEINDYLVLHYELIKKEVTRTQTECGLFNRKSTERVFPV